MAVSGIGGGTSVYAAYQTQATAAKKASTSTSKAASDTSDTGVSLEISEEAAEAAKSAESTETAEATSDSKSIDRDAIIKKLNQELDAHTQQMQNLVNELLGKQAGTYTTSLADMYKKVAELADPETIEQAKKDIADDGYWGVEQTSDRMVEMAKALSGNDPAQADKMIAAVKKGLDQAGKAWGQDLPEISGKTVDATVKKLEAWRDGLETDK